MPFFNHNNGNISYIDQGEGNPIVLIHGFGLDKRQWDLQTAALVKTNHRTITYDMRGFGKSDIPTGTYSHEDDLKALLKHLKVEKVHLVGSSFGAVPAMRFAIKYPEKTRALTLLAPSLGSDVIDESSPFNRYEELAGKGNLRQLEKEMLTHKSMLSLQQHPKALVATSTMIKNYLQKTGGWHFMHKDPSTVVKNTLIQQMNKISCATQILIGQEDYEFSKNVARIVFEHISNAQLHQIEKAGHLINLEHPQIVNEIIINFDKKNFIN